MKKLVLACLFFASCSILSPDPLKFDGSATFKVVSVGLNTKCPGGSSPCNFAEFFRDGDSFYIGGRGFNVASINPSNGKLFEPPKSFDTWMTSDTGEAMRGMIDYINRQPNGAVILIAVGDDAGLYSLCCQPYGQGTTQALEGVRLLESMGARQIRQYSFRDGWSFITIKGVGSQAEKYAASGQDAATVEYKLKVK
jgi:hypothetical protein